MCCRREEQDHKAIVNVSLFEIFVLVKHTTLARFTMSLSSLSAALSVIRFGARSTTFRLKQVIKSIVRRISLASDEDLVLTSHCVPLVLVSPSLPLLE